MQDHTAFSSDALRILTRLSRQLRSLDGYRISLSNKHDTLWLIERTATDPRPEVNTIAEELFQSITPDERAYLEHHGISLGDHDSAQKSKQDDDSTNLVRRVYRGKVYYEEPSEAKPADETHDPSTSSGSGTRRVYRGQIIEG